MARVKSSSLAQVDVHINASLSTAFCEDPCLEQLTNAIIIMSAMP